MKIKRGDMVIVMAGNDKGDSKDRTPRKVVQTLDGGRKLVVEGVNRVKKHVRKGHPKSPAGGQLTIEMPIDASNVMLQCTACGRPVRVGFRYDADGRKERFCKKCKASLGSVSRANPARASRQAAR